LPEVSAREIELYERHFAVLQQWNQNIGLVSRKSIDLSFAIHYVDSLFIASTAAKYVKDDVMDLGCGAGFPGMIFAIRYPEIPVVLYEKSLKKQSFLTAALAALDLPNVEIRGAFPEEKVSGLLLARAVLPPPELFLFARKRLYPGSILVANRGGLAPEIETPKEFVKHEELVYSLPLDQGNRRVEVFEKVPRGT